jgi:hypothetical protein
LPRRKTRGGKIDVLRGVRVTATRIAENEALFRDVNERIKDITAGQRAPDEGDFWEFLCECGTDACVERIDLTLAEYEKLRSNPKHFAVVPGHELPAVERVVETSDRFLVLEKVGEGAKIAEDTDPRRR